MLAPQVLSCRGATGIAFAINHNAVLCTDSRVVLGSIHTHSPALLSALHVSWSWGVRTYQAALKSETLDCQFSIYSCHLQFLLQSSYGWDGEYRSSTMPLYTLTITHSHTLTITCTCCLMKSKEFKTKISHAHSLILSLPSPLIISMILPWPLFRIH